MPDQPFIHIKVTGVEKLQAALQKFPRQIAKYLGNAGREAAIKYIFSTRGIKARPEPFYLSRTEVYGEPFQSDKQRRWFFAALRNKKIEVPYRRGQSPGSEKSEQKWYAKSEGYNTKIGNIASYAMYLHGDEQSKYMVRKGWRKLLEVAQEKISDITRVYQLYVDKLIRDLQL